MYKTIKLRDYPEVKAIIQAADPTYRKHEAYIEALPTVTLSGTYWSGGSISTYTAVNLATKVASLAPQFDPPQFGGPSSPPKVELPRGCVIVRTGAFCGKKATATVHINPLDLTPALAQD